MGEVKGQASLSVIITSYNYGSFLAEAIDSVLGQSFLPDELLLVDDGSTDKSRDIMLSYAEAYPGLIRVDIHADNMGIVETFSKAVSDTSGDYICFLGADNLFSPNYLEKCFDVLESDENILIAYTDYALFGSRARVVYESHRAEWRGAIENDKLYRIEFPEFNDGARDMLKTSNFIHGSSMYRRSAYESCGGYREPSGGSPEDHDLFTRMLAANEPYGIARKVHDAVLLYRQHSEAQANIKSQIASKAAAYDDVVAHWQRDVAELMHEVELRDRRIVELTETVESLSFELEKLSNTTNSRTKKLGIRLPFLGNRN